MRVYDGLEVKQIECGRRSVNLVTDQGLKVTAGQAVIACGYESLKFLPFSVAAMETTYAFITKPLDKAALWADRTLLWETKTPYLYIRTTEDHRLLAGGRDDDYHQHQKRDRALPHKTRALAQDVEKLLGLKIKPDFAWAGAFGSTRESLGYLGSIKHLPRVQFILGFGGNGILYSQIGAELVRDAVLGRQNNLKEVFSFDR